MVRRPGKQASAKDVIAYLETRGIAKYKLPEYFVELPEFPMTASGKIQKFQLRDGFVSGKFGQGQIGR